MPLYRPKIVALDTATLGRVSHDYWAQDASLRDKARTLIKRLQCLGMFITFTATHVGELLRHGDEQVVRGRLRFLRSLPLIAWLRPYDRSWRPGFVHDLLCREMHVVVHGSARSWREIVEQVRPDLWETGVGSEMFVENDEFWSTISRRAAQLHEKEKYTASMARTDAGEVKDMKVSEALRLPLRPKEDRDAYARRFARELQRQLDLHGDKRLGYSHGAATDFANGALQTVEAIEEMGGNLVKTLLVGAGVPLELVSPEMTMGEFGELAVYAERLKMISEDLRPSTELMIDDVPPTTLPSYVLERRLVSAQRKAERVSGSDLGDSYIVPLVFYTDAVEVDTRTFEFLNQIRRSEPKLASLMGRVFPSSDYSRIPESFDD